MNPTIIVPYRDRADNLKEFIPAINSYLPNAEVFVIEQMDNAPFNKGALINIGVKITMADYYMFHDVDLIPVNVDYSYSEIPTHVATELGQYGYKMPYANYFGGCVIFTKKHYEAINGFSNKFQGWGCEDDMFYENFIEKGIPIMRRAGRFESLYHSRENNTAQFADNVKTMREGRDYSEGYSSVEYEMLHFTKKDGYWLAQVKIK